MVTMYKKGSDPIQVQEGQVENAIQRGWSLKKPTSKKQVKSNDKE